MRSLLLLITLLLSLVVHAEIDPKAAYAEVTEGKAVLIDVREEDEIKSGMLQKARWFPLSRIQKDKNWKAEFQKMTQGKKIILHCRSGARSGQFRSILQGEGIPSLNLGGFESLKRILPVRSGR
jgi:rhodanese-related sulfurtransferase